MSKLRLDSWKSIAEHLKRSARTVQRWHAEYGLPVHHFGGSKGPVFAFAEELDEWLSGFSEAPARDSNGAGQMHSERRREASVLIAEASGMWALSSERNLGRIAALYRGAIDLDPANAAALIGLANTLVQAALVGVLSCAAAWPRAEEALKRALRLQFEPEDSRCAAAWLQMAYERQWRPAREGFDEVLATRPHHAHALTGRALLHVVEGRLPQASRCLRDAWRLNPLASVVTSYRCWVDYLAGECEQALELIAQARESGDHSSLNAAIEALALLETAPAAQRLRQIEALARSFPGCLVLKGALGYACGLSDQTGRAWEIAQNLKRMKGDCAYPVALVMLGLDDRPQAMSWLESSWAEGSLWSLGFRSDPLLRPLAAEERFAALLRKSETRAESNKPQTGSQRREQGVSSP